MSTVVVLPVIFTAEEMLVFATAMRAVAEANPISDYDAFMAAMMTSGNVERHGMLAHSRGSELPECIKKYTQFRVIKELPLQITFMHVAEPGERLVRQLSVVSICKTALPEDLKALCCTAFFGIGPIPNQMSAPPHVFVTVKYAE